MNNFEKQLNNLPKARLSRRVDLAIRHRLISAGMKQGFFNMNFFSMPALRPVLAAAVILVLVFSSVTSVYAYNSSEITRASALYPVKRGLEKLEARFISTPEAQVRFHNKLAERRIAEAQFLSQTSANPPASSTGELMPSKLEHENEFNDTLRDADDEIEQANDRAGEISDRLQLDRSLALLSDSHLNDLDKIKTIAEKVGIESDESTTDNIALVLDNIKNRQQIIVRAISQFNGDLKWAEIDPEDATSTAEEKLGRDERANSTPAEAENSLDLVKSEVKDLESELAQGERYSAKQIKQLTERLNKKINQAESAIKSGDLNKFNGLLRATEALTNNGRHFFHENKLEKKELEISDILPAGGLKAQYNLQELRQKQLEQQKKLEEERKGNLKKNATTTMATSTPEIATSSPNDVSDQSGDETPDRQDETSHDVSSTSERQD